jgi:hypothetical protein
MSVLISIFLSNLHLRAIFHGNKISSKKRWGGCEMISTAAAVRNSQQRLRSLSKPLDSGKNKIAPALCSHLIARAAKMTAAVCVRAFCAAAAPPTRWVWKIALSLCLWR